MPRTKSLYSVHPGVLMTQKWVAELKGKTGRSLPEWLALVKKSGPKTEVERRQWLKEKHGLGTNSAWWVAERAAGKGTETDESDAPSAPRPKPAPARPSCHSTAITSSLRSSRLPAPASTWASRSAAARPKAASS